MPTTREDAQIQHPLQPSAAADIALTVLGAFALAGALLTRRKEPLRQPQPSISGGEAVPEPRTQPQIPQERSKLSVKSLSGLAKESFQEWQADGALDLGAALAYYASSRSPRCC